MRTAVELDLSVNLAPLNPRGLVISNPVIGASGTVAYGKELGEVSDLSRIGAIVCKGITRYPRAGNPQPRLAETSAGLLNTIGLQNVGAEAAADTLAPQWATWPIKVIANISGETATEFGEIARILDGRPGISGLEVNIGCPNVERGGLEFGVDARAAALVTETVKKNTSLPVMVKLTPNVTDIAEISRAVVDSGADCISLVNTYVGLTIDVPKRRPTLSTVTGGSFGAGNQTVGPGYGIQGRGCGRRAGGRDGGHQQRAGCPGIHNGRRHCSPDRDSQLHQSPGLRGGGGGVEGVHGTAGRRHLVQYRGGGQGLGSGRVGMIVPPKRLYDRISSVVIMRISHLTESHRKGPRRG